MIGPKGDKGKVWVNFQDWTPVMVALSSKLHRLPDPPGEPVPRNHEAGIDWLSKLAKGKAAIDALWALVDDLPYRPGASDVIRMGQLALKADAELEELLTKKKNSTRTGKEKYGRPECVGEPRMKLPRYFPGAGWLDPHNEHPVLKPRRDPAIKDSLAQTRRRLLLMGFTTAMRNDALRRGCPPGDEFQTLYAKFVRTYHRQVNRQGKMILGSLTRARYYACLFLNEHGFRAVSVVERELVQERQRRVARSRCE